MGGLGDNLPDLGEIVHSEGFSYGRKGEGVMDVEIEGHETPQDALNVETLEVVGLGAKFASIPFTHEIRAVEDGNINQKPPNMLKNANERTLDLTKHPPGRPTTTESCKIRFDAIFVDPTCSDDPGRPQTRPTDDAKSIRAVDDATFITSRVC